MDKAIKINHQLKMDLKKKQFVSYFKEKLQQIDVDSNLQDILLLLIQSAEDEFFKKGKKLGHLKQQAVLETLRGLLKKPIDEKVIIGMIDSIVLNQDIRRTSFLIRCYKAVKAYFRKADD
jgi:hypothetical protein